MLLSAVSALLIAARIDGHPESNGAFSLMQYAAQSEFQDGIETDEQYACKDFCKKSQCTWFVCKGCSFCPKDTEGCKSFCRGKAQCTWGACKGCSFCPQETEGCKSWCSAQKTPWAQKCKLDACKGCEPCPEPTPELENCKPWCGPNRSPWNQKCKLDACKGCEPCPEATPAREDCKPWCGPNRSPWNQKCKLDACKGCEPCPEPTPTPVDCAPYCGRLSVPWKEKCMWGECKGCDGCPERPPEPPHCKFWCSRVPVPWETKCNWKRGCGECEPCPKSSEGCASWCNGLTTPWKQTCALASCKGCAACPEPTPEPVGCRSWCSTLHEPWEELCSALEVCQGCDDCPEATPTARPTYAPTPTPTKPAPPTPPPTYSKEDFQYLTDGRSCADIGLQPIMDFELCDQAAEAIDFSFPDSRRSDGGPEGCYKHRGSHLYLNTAPRSKGKGSTSMEIQICVRGPPPPPLPTAGTFKRIEEYGKSCADFGYEPIMSPILCDMAASWLHLHHYETQKTSASSYVEGCYWYDGYDLYMNQNPSAKGNGVDSGVSGLREQLCIKRTPAPKKPRPAPTYSAGDFKVVESGSCADIGLQPIMNFELCDQAATALDLMSDPRSSRTKSSGKPEGCWKGSSLWLSTNPANQGNGGTSSERQLCVKGPPPTPPTNWGVFATAVGESCADIGYAPILDAVLCDVAAAWLTLGKMREAERSSGSGLPEGCSSVPGGSEGFYINTNPANKGNGGTSNRHQLCHKL